MTTQEIRSPMAATVLEFAVTAGQAVRCGDVLAVVEAMKMEHELRAPQDARVLALLAAAGGLGGQGGGGRRGGGGGVWGVGAGGGVSGWAGGGCCGGAAPSMWRPPPGPRRPRWRRARRC